MNKTFEIYLGNWGTVVCESEQERDYMRAAKSLSDLVSSIASWYGSWLSKDMEKQYLDAEKEERAKCDNLWNLIPNNANFTKCH